jgi:D-arabinose 1-dehydrogenase-like Zn-dependent alcohol dehydrogenase
MGFDTVAISSGAGKEKDAKEFGARHYIDASKENAAAELKKLGGARVILATAFDVKAMSALIDGLGAKGELLVAGADHHSLTVTPLQLIGGRRKIIGVASGHAKDNEEGIKFCSFSGVKTIVEKYPLDKVQEAYNRMLSNQCRYRVVLNPWANTGDKL